MNADLPAHRDPADLKIYQICPHCKTVLVTCPVRCDGHVFETYGCRAHGAVVPVNSHVANPADRGERRPYFFV